MAKVILTTLQYTYYRVFVVLKTDTGTRYKRRERFAGTSFWANQNDRRHIFVACVKAIQSRTVPQTLLREVTVTLTVTVTLR